MEIIRTATADQVELKLKGRLDAIWSDHVAKALAECVRAGQHVLALEMSEVDFISSAGIRILVIYTKQLKAINGRLAVTNASEIVRSVLQLAGLGGLLRADAGPAPAKAAASEPPAAPIALAHPGATAVAYDLDPTATLQVEWRGDAAAWLAGQAPAEAGAPVEFSAQTLGLGLGALGGGATHAERRLGEFLAAGGAAVCQPADGTHKPDYMLLQGALTPQVQIAYGLVARGGFRRLLRFDTGAEQAHLPLSAVVQACREAVGGGAVGLVMVAETAALIGAALQKTPSSSAEQSGGIFAFPAVRDWLSFTAEAALVNTTALVVGVATDAAHGPQHPLLKPLVRSGELLGHLHGAAFPYRPLRKGRVELAPTVQRLFDSEQVLGLLHLLNDWRPANGAGESRFLRGACWCAPVDL